MMVCLRTSCSRRVATLLLLTSLIISSTGYMVCVRADGRAAVEFANLLLDCVDQCHLPESDDGQLAFDDTSCVDYLILGLLTIRQDRIDTNIVPSPQLIAFGPHGTEACHSMLWPGTSSQSDPPNLQVTGAIRLTVLLI